MDCALRYMLGAFRERGVLNKEIEIKMFGGADTLISQSSNTIGSKNVQAALTILREEHLSVVAMDVGDSFGRKLIFHSQTGEVFLKRLRNVEQSGKCIWEKKIEVLIVDDSAVVRRTLSEILSSDPAYRGYCDRP